MAIVAAGVNAVDGTLPIARLGAAGGATPATRSPPEPGPPRAEEGDWKGWHFKMLDERGQELGTA